MMKSLERLVEYEQKKLHALFPKLLELIENTDRNSYQQLAISVFDRRLNESEASILLEDVSPSEQSRRNQMHTALINSLLQTTQVLAVKIEDDESRLSFFRFSSAEAASSYFEHTSRQRYVAVLPAFKAVYFEGYDDTNHLFFIDRVLVNSVINLANDAQFYVW